MKLLRYGPVGEEKPAMLDELGVMRDLSGIVPDISQATIGAAGLDQLRDLDPAGLPVVPDGVRIGACVGGVGNFIAVGLNYVDHALESQAPIPTEPVIFSKTTSCISGPYDDIVLPPGSSKPDWEAEIAFVIGAPAYRVSQADALSVVAGFCVSHDVSERAFQLERGGQWLKGKSSPTFGPLGPWLVTTDEVADVQDLRIWLDHNGVRRQDGTTSEMIFSIAFIVSYVTQFMRLMPGDVVTTGTPVGVGMARRPPIYLKAGDVVELGIDGLGRQRQTVRTWQE